MISLKYKRLSLQEASIVILLLASNVPIYTSAGNAKAQTILDRLTGQSFGSPSVLTENLPGDRYAISIV